MSSRVRTLCRYVVAIVVTALALTGRVALEPVLGPYQRYVTFYLGVITVAALVGTGPAIVTAALGFAAASQLVPPPTSTPFGRMAAGAAFVFINGVLIAVFDAIRKSRTRELAHVVHLHDLARASLAIGASPTLQAMLETLTREARVLIGAQHAVTTVQAEAPGTPPLVAVDATCGDADVADPSARAGMADVVRRTGRPVRLPSPVRTTAATPLRGWLAAP